MVTLRPHGVGRFVTAAFLAFWLCGWAIGEAFALWILGNGAAALITGMPLGPGHAPLQAGPALAVGGFVLLWLAFWTLGGFLAIRELLRLLLSEDQFSAGGSGLVVMRRLGAFRTSREFPRDTLRRILLAPPHGALAIETSAATVELSRLGTRAEREAAVNTLRSELGIPDIGLASDPDPLPKGWEEIITPEGDRAIVPDLAVRKVQARVAFVVTLAIGAVAFAIARESIQRLGLIPFAILFALATLALVWGTVWLARGRPEWRIGNGRVILRRRFGSNVRDLFEAQRLELVATSDSDGDDWFALEAVAAAAGTPGPGAASTPGPGTQALGRFSPASMKHRRRVTSALHDPNVPRRLGAYLARVGSIPFEDRATPEVREAEVAALREQLEKSGPLGRFAVNLVVKIQKQKRM
jgi:hypothetical protein